MEHLQLLQCTARQRRPLRSPKQRLGRQAGVSERRDEAPQSTRVMVVSDIDDLLTFGPASVHQTICSLLKSHSILPLDGIVAHFIKGFMPGGCGRSIDRPRSRRGTHTQAQFGTGPATPVN